MRQHRSPRAKSAARAHVIDGDGIEVDGARVRLFGIDAPEMRQPCRNRTGGAYGCGEQARAALQQVAEGRQVSCIVKTRDKYRRAVSVCSVADGSEDIGGIWFEQARQSLILEASACMTPRSEKLGR
jgi:endonuclease YncB( thermonuclease family)